MYLNEGCLLGSVIDLTDQGFSPRSFQHTRGSTKIDKQYSLFITPVMVHDYLWNREIIGGSKLEALAPMVSEVGAWFGTAH